jgi:hypothetical protein
MKLTGENRQLGEKPVPVPLCPPQISHALDLGFFFFFFFLTFLFLNQISMTIDVLHVTIHTVLTKRPIGLHY